MFPRFFPSVIQFLEPEGERCRFRMALAGSRGRLGLVGRELFCWCSLDVELLSRRANSFDLSKYTNLIAEGPYPNTPLFWLPLSSLKPLVLCTTPEVLLKNHIDTSRLHELHLKVESDIDEKLSDVLPTRIRTFTLELLTSKSLQPRSLPRNLTHLILGRPFKCALRPRCLPTHLRSLTLGFWYNQPLEMNVLPPYLERLTLGEEFNRTLDVGVLPRGLRYLRFGYWYDQPIRDRVLPMNLKSLVFGEWYNKPLTPEVLPTNLRHLQLGLMYCHPLCELPNGLRTLRFANDGSQNLPDMLPRRVGDLLAVEYSRTPGESTRQADPAFYEPFFDDEERRRLLASTRRHR